MPHVQILRVGHTEFKSNRSCKILDDLLPRLPQDCLEFFEFGTSGYPEYHQLQWLWRSQKRLTNVQLAIGTCAFSDTPSAPFIEDLLRQDFGALQSLKSVKQLSLRIGEVTDLVSCGRLVSSLQYTRLEKVSLELDDPWDIGGYRPLEYDLFSCFFPHTIRCMSLCKIALPSSKTVQLDSWPSLTDLTIDRCENVVPMLANYSAPKLTTFVFQGYNEEADDLEDMETYAISSMLKRFCSLQHLRIRLVWANPESEEIPTASARLAESIIYHSAQLKSLVYGIKPGIVMWPKTITPITAAVKRCANLEELALWWVKSSQVVSMCKVSLSYRYNQSR